MINRGIRCKALSEVKPVVNISKNLLSFLELRPVLKRKYFLIINYETKHMSSRNILD